jgi:hypothetical protein
MNAAAPEGRPGGGSMTKSGYLFEKQVIPFRPQETARRLFF